MTISSCNFAFLDIVRTATPDASALVLPEAVLALMLVNLEITPPLNLLLAVAGKAHDIDLY